MPTVKPGSKDATKIIGSLATTPRKARNKSKKQHSTQSGNETTADENGTHRSRSQSRGRRLLDAAVARMSLGRSRSKSKTRSTTKQLEISAPILLQRPNETFGQSPLVIAPEALGSLANARVHEPMNAYVSPSVQQTVSTTTIRSTSSPSPPNPRTLMSENRVENRPMTEDFRDNSDTPSVDQWDESMIIARVMASDPHPQVYCDTCLRRVFPDDRYNLVGHVIHRDCFICSQCGAGLINRSSVCRDGVWSCAVHVQFDGGYIDE